MDCRPSAAEFPNMHHMSFNYNKKIQKESPCIFDGRNPANQLIWPSSPMFASFLNLSQLLLRISVVPWGELDERDMLAQMYTLKV